MAKPKTLTHLGKTVRQGVSKNGALPKIHSPPKTEGLTGCPFCRRGNPSSDKTLSTDPRHFVTIEERIRGKFQRTYKASVCRDHLDLLAGLDRIIRCQFENLGEID